MWAARRLLAAGHRRSFRLAPPSASVGGRRLVQREGEVCHSRPSGAVSGRVRVVLCCGGVRGSERGWGDVKCGADRRGSTRRAAEVGRRSYSSGS